ncbi:MAG: hypothetical protein PSX71_14530 [bacterium]|nr:hypothetical protein [bacterium]
MPHHVSGWLIYLIFLLPSLAAAEQGFYQEVDPDGHVRIIKAPFESGLGAKKVKPAPVTEDKQRDSASEPVYPDVSLPNMESVPEKFAPYDSDTYLDSERLESSKFNPEQKSNFYIINDGLGSRVEQSAIGVTEVPDVKSIVQNPVEKRLDLPFEREEVRGTALMMAILATNTLCLGSEALSKSTSLAKGRFYSLILEKKALQYRGPLGIVGAYKLSGNGMKTLMLRSYARSERDPDFVSPVLAMADDKGCVTRIVTGYFQSRYEATKAKHSMLEGEVTIHADEPYVLIISSEYQSPAGKSYKQSQYGQLSIKWQP